MILDLRHAAYSGFGSYFTIARINRASVGSGLFIRTLHGDADPSNIFELIVLEGGKPVPFRENASASSVKLETDNGWVEICIIEANVIRIRTSNVGFRLFRQKPEDHGYHADYPFIYEENRIQINAFRSRKQYMVTVLKGVYQIQAPWDEVTCPMITIDILPDAVSN